MTEQQPEVGSLAEEAAKLLAVAADWWHEARDRAGEKLADTGNAAECQLCPFCQLLGVLRGARPEVFEHLVTAMHSLMLAARAVVDAQSERRGAAVERIDLT